MVFLVVADHVAMAYALRFGDMWFVKDPTRSSFYDAAHLLVDSFHMPIFFFLAGLFILPSAHRRGIGNFMKERWIKLGIPFVLGVLFLCSPQTYPQYLQKGGNLGYWDYVIQKFFHYDWYASSWLNFDYPAFTGELRPSGFWFLYFLMVLSILSLVIWKTLPFVIRWLETISTWILNNPVKGYLAVSFLSSLLIAYMELFWGTRFWMGFWKLFYVRANLMPLYILFFALGIGLQQAGLLKTTHWLDQLANNWIRWLGWTVVLSIAYVSYCFIYFNDGAYSLDIVAHFYRDGEWSTAWPVLLEAGPLIWIRSTLHGFLYTAQTITLVALFYKVFNGKKPFWIAASGASYGIYIFHEPFCVWGVYLLSETSAPILFKYLVVVLSGYMLSWILVHKIILKISLGRRLIG